MAGKAGEGPDPELVSLRPQALFLLLLWLSLPIRSSSIIGNVCAPIICHRLPVYYPSIYLRIHSSIYLSTHHPSPILYLPAVCLSVFTTHCVYIIYAPIALFKTQAYNSRFEEL